MSPLLLKNIKEIWRDKKILTVSLFSPVFLLFLFHFFYRRAEGVFDHVPIAVVNPEPGFPSLGRLLVLALKRVTLADPNRPVFSVSEMTRSEAMQRLELGNLAAVLVVPDHFTQTVDRGSSGKLILFLNKRDARGPYIEPALRAFTEQFGLVVLQSRKKIARAPVELAVAEESLSAEAPPESRMLPSIALFAFIFLIPYAAGLWIGEIERESLMRFRLAKISGWTIYSATFLSCAFLAILQMISLEIAGHVWGGVGAEFSSRFFPVALFLALASLGPGFLFSAFLEKEKQLNLYSSLILVPLYVLSGGMGIRVSSGGWVKLLPWYQGFAILSGTAEPSEQAAWGIMAGSSLILACLGFLLFARKRLYHA